MKKFLKYGLLALLVLAMTAALAGCGGSKPAPSQTQGQSQNTAQKKLIVGSDTTFAPFEFSENGKYVGFDVDLINALAKEAGYTVDFRSMSFDGLIPALQTGQIDAAISAMSIKPDRAKVVNFTDPYYASGLSIVVQAKNDTVKSFNDLKGKKIAVQSGTTGADMAKTITSNVTYFTNTDQALMDLKNGAVDAVINDDPVNRYFIEKQGNKDVKIVGQKLTSENYGIAVPKSKPQVLKDLNAALQKIKANGTYASIYKKWLGVEPPK